MISQDRKLRKKGRCRDRLNTGSGREEKEITWLNSKERKEKDNVGY